MKNKKPKVSIGMPVWNGEDFIKLTLDSLLAQDFKDFEIIVSDNASTDNTKKICEEYVKKDERIKYILQDENIGADKNFNFVLDRAIGEYFMWAAYDDLWEPAYISEMIKALNNNKSVILASCINDEIDENGNLIKTYFCPVGISPKGTIFKRVFSFLNKGIAGYIIFGLMKTQIIKKIGGFGVFKEKIRKDRLNRGVYAVDGLTVFRLIFEGDFYIVNKVLFHHRLMRKDTDLYLKSQKKLDIILLSVLKVLKMFPNVHGYVAKIRRIIFESDLNFYQKYFLFCVTWMYEFKMYTGYLFYYFSSFLKFIYKFNYRKEYYDGAIKYNPTLKENQTKKR
ncbi:putative glycosyl transferase, family 2 [groundwater metagenome]|uniref:Putative glycosyl transferase, family 2 n=1 Tax=groundwater metagenome TaxID=717931 RepID=A0A098EAS3_9ZZZZ